MTNQGRLCVDVLLFFEDVLLDLVVPIDGAVLMM
jgi:hypothetical protein